MSVHASLRMNKVFESTTCKGQACASKRKKARRLANMRALEAQAMAQGLPVAIVRANMFLAGRALVVQRERDEERLRELNRRNYERMFGRY